MSGIQSRDLSVERIFADVTNPHAGATVIFVGTVRKDRKLKALDYEAYDEMAVRELNQLKRQAAKKFKLTEVAVVHRKGRLAVGDKVIIVACSAPHRQEAFKACEWLVSEIKKIVPIWKKEIR